MSSELVDTTTIEDATRAGKLTSADNLYCSSHDRDLCEGTMHALLLHIALI